MPATTEGTPLNASKSPRSRVIGKDGSLHQPIEGDLARCGESPTLDISVVCPFYNEEQIVGAAIRTLHTRLQDNLDASWELIVVDDGSSDDSRRIAEEMRPDHSNLRVLSYRFNRGRGHALRTGIEQSRGRIVVTTEIDLSWGEDIVERLVAAMSSNPDADVVVASPHLPGGGYKNVPAKRVLLSRFGNWVIRSCMTQAATMNTGMTRAYRRESIRNLPLDEDGKEFHLEVILKGRALGYRIAEIPAVLEWKQYKHAGQRVKRKSSSKINKLMLSHSLFSLFANPIRYIWPLSGVSMIVAAGFFIVGLVRLAMQLVSVYMLIVSLAFAIISLILFLFGVITQQGNMVQVEMWRTKQELAQIREQLRANVPGEKE